MKQKIIVTGGCGYIGSHTVIELINNNFEVVIVDDLSNSNKHVLEQIKSITGVKPLFEEVDLKNEALTQKVFKTHNNAKAIIHFAAYKAVGESVEEPLTYYENNLYSLINVLKAQLKYNIHHFIFSSSCTVYGVPETLPLTEQHNIKRPFSPYGNTKKIAEEILEDITKTNKTLSVISLRYFNPIGAHESGLIGELPNGVPNNLMPYITQTAIGIREQLMVFGDNYPTKDGTPIRDYIHVVDLAQAHLVALMRLLKNKQKSSFETFNLGTGKGYSVLEIIKIFEAVTGIALNYKITTPRAGDVAATYASTNKASHELGWKAKYTLHDMIASSWKWEQYLSGLATKHWTKR